MSRIHVLSLTPYIYIEYSCYAGCFSIIVETSRVNSFIQKPNGPMVFSNYRPMSVLPAYSKIFERTMYSQLLSFINKHKLLYSYQFGFRINHALEITLSCLDEKIFERLENG